MKIRPKQTDYQLAQLEATADMFYEDAREEVDRMLLRTPLEGFRNPGGGLLIDELIDDEQVGG